MQTNTITTSEETRHYFMVNTDGTVRGEIRLRPDQVRQYSIHLGVKLMRHLPQPKAYDINCQEVVV